MSALDDAAAPPREEPNVRGPFITKNPTPPAPEDGTRDTGWVIETTRGGLYGRFIGAAPGGSGWSWMDGLERARIYDTEIEALRFGCAAVGPNRVRRVVRSPGKRQFELTETGQSAAFWIWGNGMAGWARELPSAPGAWQLDPDGGAA